ncbi:MAG: toll/interleukin-1 receptor domain-containing protein [Deltaproteobacteria bacterium]|nr:toll/interleukin-1 receptor domain-containing protein [Deltaproteobacteria bacterium]
MSDIFISYASEDRGRVLPLVQALEKTGWTIFWDRNIPAGKTWHQRMGEEIKTCGCVLVVWTEKSVQSDWVVEEAEIGKRRQILVPIMLDEVEPPFGFGLIQAANLVAWNGSNSEPSFRRMISDIETILGPAPAKGLEVEIPRRSTDKPERKSEHEPRQSGEERGRHAKGKLEDVCDDLKSERLGAPPPSSKAHTGGVLLRFLRSGATKSYTWFKREARNFLTSLIVSVALIVVFQISLGWDLAPGEISVIVLFVWVIVAAINRLFSRWKRKRTHAAD